MTIDSNYNLCDIVFRNDKPMMEPRDEKMVYLDKEFPF
jgi:hypothetical protein